MTPLSVPIRSWRSVIAAATIAAIALGALAAEAPAARRLITQEESRHLGLERAWFAQVRLDRARNHVERAILVADRLSVLTSAGILQEINALTGETLWIAPVGNPDYPSLGPAANDHYLALVNGSTLYVLDRTDGRPVVIRRVGGAPGAAPAVAEKYVFVPLVNGRVEGYPLDKQILTPWYYQSFGQAMVAPLATAESVVWTTDSGHMYVGGSNKLGVRFRLETGSEIVAPPAYQKPFVYAATLSGELFAVHELAGTRRWKCATGFPVTRAPAAVGERVFISTAEPALHCVDAANGHALWKAPHVTQFAAASRNRVYGMDDLGAVVVLDASSGAPLGRIPTDGTTNTLVNGQTDRLYLVSGDGVVQCLHEVGAKEPLYHIPTPSESQPPAEPSAERSTETTAASAATPAQPSTSEGASPPAGSAPLAEGEEDAAAPAAGAAEKPANESGFGVDEDNPFDF